MARDNKGFFCHAHHEMVSYEIHHIFPLGYGGSDTAANKVKICPNAHSDAHYAMERMFRGKPIDWAEYGPAVRYLARRGYNEVMAHAEELAAEREEKINAATLDH